MSEIQKLMSFFKKYIHNWFFYTGLLFLIWVAFFDENSLTQQIKLSKEINDLNDKEKFYNEEIKTIDEEIGAYNHDTALLERFAREKYYMKKDNEEVFVIVREGEEQK